MHVQVRKPPSLTPEEIATRNVFRAKLARGGASLPGPAPDFEPSFLRRATDEASTQAASTVWKISVTQQVATATGLVWLEIARGKGASNVMTAFGVFLVTMANIAWAILTQPGAGQVRFRLELLYYLAGEIVTLTGAVQLVAYLLRRREDAAARREAKEDIRKLARMIKLGAAARLTTTHIIALMGTGDAKRIKDARKSGASQDVIDGMADDWMAKENELIAKYKAEQANKRLIADASHSILLANMNGTQAHAKPADVARTLAKRLGAPEAFDAPAPAAVTVVLPVQATPDLVLRTAEAVTRAQLGESARTMMEDMKSIFTKSAAMQAILYPSSKTSFALASYAFAVSSS